MRSKVFIAISALVGVTFSTISVAGCDKPAPGYDTTYCFVKLFIESDNELNDAWKRLTDLLKPEQKKKLIAVQRDWIKYRNDACSKGGEIMVDCAYKVNKSRTKALLDRTTECKIGACKEDALYSREFSAS